MGMIPEGKDFLRVGELAKAAGKTVRALHLYEEMGLLKPTSRSSGGYRLYSSADAVARVNWITKLQEMGFSLPEIQSFLSDFESSPTASDAMGRVRAIFEAKLQETRATIQRMRVLERDLQASLAYLESCCCCEPSKQHSECATCGRHGHDPAEKPELVAGLATHGTGVAQPRTRAQAKSTAKSTAGSTATAGAEVKAKAKAKRKINAKADAKATNPSLNGQGGSR
ncbi:MAG: MerR family transcriptional regulator [Pseudomonadota bacterium]